MCNISYLLLGGNQGETQKMFLQAQEMLGKMIGEISAASPVYRTEPWGFDTNEYFLNQVVCINTHLEASELLQKILEIEILMGRERSGTGYESRIIDIDILFYNDCIINDENLIIPHPRMHLRNFALFPMADLFPEFVHPIFNVSISQLKVICPDKHIVIEINDKQEIKTVADDL